MDNSKDKLYQALYSEYGVKKAQAEAMGGPKALESQHRSGKWSARERVEYLFDQGTFVEIGKWVKHRTVTFGIGQREVPADGVITGYGRVEGRLVAVAAEDYTSMAGTFGEYHGKKFAEIIDFAKTKGIPFVGINDSGGARLQEGMDTLEAYAWLFRSQIQASGIIPQIATLMGPCLGGQAYHPVMQDFVFQCRHTGFMGIAGPAFVKAQTGKEIDLQTLAGVGSHAVTTGQTHVVAEDDQDCLDRVKELLRLLPSNNKDKPPVVLTGDDPERQDPELDNLIPPEPFVAFDMHEVIVKIVDNGYFFEIQRDHARNIITGFARMDGRTVGIVASQPKWVAGAIDCDASDKAARFIRFCDLFSIPLLNFHDTPGFWIGPQEEWKGILRHGAKMLYAYIESTVPKISIIIRKSFAGAYLAMCCKDTGADVVLAWPTARITIVGAETAASVIFAKEIKSATNPKEVEQARIQEYRDMFENPYKAAERGYVDDIIRPRETRKYINRALDVLEQKQEVRPWRKYSNINL